MSPMPAATKPLNDRLRFITADGQLNQPEMDKATDERAAKFSNQARYSRSIWSREFATFTADDWRRLAREDVEAEADGQMALYEIRVSRLAPEFTLIAAE